MKEEVSRRNFIKAGAIGVAGAALGPSIFNVTNTFGQSAAQENRMFCYPCEQTANSTGCTTTGVCGNSSNVAALHDLLVYSLKGPAIQAVAGRKKGIEDKEVNRFIPAALFSTLTNVDFDPERLIVRINKAVTLREQLKQKVGSAGGALSAADGSTDYQPASTTQELISQGQKVGLKSDTSINPDILSLQHTLLFGLKGLSAYADHARELGPVMTLSIWSRFSSSARGKASRSIPMARCCLPMVTRN